jgi:hypothetical protein
VFSVEGFEKAECDGDERERARSERARREA